MDILTLAQLNKLKASGGIGYSEYETVELISEQTATEEMLAIRCPNAGDEVTVYLNGVAYTHAAKYSELEGIQCVYIGNGVEFNGEETEDGFGLCFVAFGGQTVAIFVPYGELSETESITISAIGKIRINHPIDKAYIPFWDIRYYNNDGVYGFTANGKNLDLDKAIEVAKSGVPCVVTGYTDSGISVASTIPCGFFYDGAVVWISYAPPTGKDIIRFRIKSDGIESV